MNCPLERNIDCSTCPFAKDDGTGRMLCDYPYHIRYGKCEVKKGESYRKDMKCYPA